MHDHDKGLAHDLKTLDAAARRRDALRWLAGAGALALLGCGGGEDESASTATTTTDTGSSASGATTTCSVIPEETAGPYPGDGSNSTNGGVANALMLSGIVRSDIRSSIAGATGIAEGVPMVVKIHLVDTNGGCADLSGHAIYLWHCTRDGNYSMYSAGITDQNYLRGVQETDSSGVASFITVFPGCYSGRMPHIHFEVYRSLTTATLFSNKLETSQLALPADVCSEVYGAATGYSASVSNMSRISFTTDNVFSDGVTSQLATVTGSVGSGYLATLDVGIAV